MSRFVYEIYDIVYNDILSGKKTIEFRLLNEKTKSIKIGDEIRFCILNDEDKYILVEVTNKFIYENIEELWKHKKVLTSSLNYSKDDFINTLYNIFGKDKVESSKIVGIEFKIKR